VRRCELERAPRRHDDIAAGTEPSQQAATHPQADKSETRF
jgi:hypothetical protein